MLSYRGAKPTQNQSLAVGSWDKMLFLNKKTCLCSIGYRKTLTFITRRREVLRNVFESISDTKFFNLNRSFHQFFQSNLLTDYWHYWANCVQHEEVFTVGCYLSNEETNYAPTCRFVYQPCLPAKMSLESTATEEIFEKKTCTVNIIILF